MGQNKIKTCPKIIIHLQNPNFNLLFQFYPTLLISISSFFKTQIPSSSFILCNPMATTPSLTAPFSNAVGLCHRTKHAPFSASLCESFSPFIFIWVLSRFVKIATFSLFCQSLVFFCHFWVLGFQLVCLNCSALLLTF